MQVLSRQTKYPVDRRAWPNVVGWFGLGIVGGWAIIASRLERGDWSFLSPLDNILFGFYLVASALIIYKLRHPDRLPPSGKFEEVSPDTQARINAAFERRKR